MRCCSSPSVYAQYGNRYCRNCGMLTITIPRRVEEDQPANVAPQSLGSEGLTVNEPTRETSEAED